MAKQNSVKLKISVLLAVCLSPCFLFAQQELDSLKSYVAAHPHKDTLSVHRLLRISELYHSGSKDSSMLFAHKALALSQSTEYKKGEMRSLFMLGTLHSESAVNSDSAYYYLFLAKQTAGELKDSSALGSAYNKVSALYPLLNDFKSSLKSKYIDSALRIYYAS